MNRSFYVLTYDICDDKRRAKIAKQMESVGDRVQASVFEAFLTTQELEKVVVRAKKVMAEKQDGLRIYYLCEDCKKKVKLAGVGRSAREPGLVII